MTASSLSTHVQQEQRYSRLPRFIHFLMRPLGYLEWARVYCHDFQNLPPLRTIPGYTIRLAGQKDIDQMIALMPRDQPSYVLRRMWKAGHSCMVACTNERVVAYDWMAFVPAQDEEFLLAARPLEAVCLNAYTDAAHRGKGLHQALLLALLHHGAQRGFKRAYTVVSVLNEKSWRAHVKLGWTLRNTIIYFRTYWLPGRPALRLSPLDDVVHINFKDHSWNRRANDED